MSQGPDRNEQFGRKIGVDDASPPKVAHGSRAASSDMTEDSNIGQRARFVQPLDRRPPPEEASAAGQACAIPPGPPAEKEIGLLPDEPSVWDASDDSDQEREP